MREIKFRAWDKKDKIMSIPFNLYEIGTVNMENGYSRKNYILLQYTGLHDKNKKEIYEGDLITNNSRNSDNPHPIEFSEGRFIARYGNLKYDFAQEIETDCVEVIGNIYENPELLKNNKGNE
jgi:uncharacterized phage protein (TIGR01671 family)